MIGADVEALNLDTNARRTTKTDQEGSYSFPQITPGNYRLNVTATGFTSAAVDQIRLLVNTPATIPVKLEIGATSETISVTADSLQVNTVDATIGNSFGTKPVLQLPFEARNVVGLLSLQPGVTFAGSNLQGGDTDRPDYRAGAVNGGKSDQANVTLDGVDANDQQNRDPFTSVLRVTLDSVQEFRVVTTNANADMGRSSGAQVTLLTKSGTNEVHGSLYEYLRNKATNANSFFNNSSVSDEFPNGIPLQKLNRNIYGASLGGPLKKNRLFLFGNWEARKDRREDSVLRTVPTESLRQGFLKYIRSDGSIATVTPQQVRTQLDPLGIGPSSAALALLSQYPLPNDPSAGDGINTSGYRFNAPVRYDTNTYIAKLDYVVDSAGKHNLFVRGNLQDDKFQDVAQFPGTAPNNTNLNNTKGLAVGFNSVFSSNKVNSFRYGITRVGLENTGVLLSPFVSFRTIDNIQGTTRPSIRKTPVHSFSDDFTWTRGKHDIKFGAQIRLVRNNRTSYANSFPTASGNASWLAASGSALNAPFPDMLSTGRVAFRDAAVAVLGLVTQGNAAYNYDLQGNPLPVGAPVGRQFNAEEYEFYIMDSWRVNKALTLTYGLRYSLMPPIYEANGYQTSSRIPLSDFFDQRVALANAGLPQSLVAPVEYVLKGQEGSRDLYPFHKKNFSPRFAFAYSPQDTENTPARWLFGGSGKSVIRGGFGMYYDAMGSGLITNYDASALGLSTSLTNQSGALTVANAPRFTSFTSIPASILLAAPAGGFPATAPQEFAITNGLDDRLKPPYTMNMNFTFGREFDKGFYVQLGYTGRLSRRTLTSEDIAMPTNLKDPASGQTYFQAATALAQMANNGVPTANVQPMPFWENFFPALAGGGLSATQGAYEYYSAYAPDYTYALYNLDVGGASKFGPYTMFNDQYSYLRVLRSIGSGNYHAFQTTVRKRFTNGDQVEFNYTLSKSIDLSSTPESANNNFTQGVITNAFSRDQFRAVSDYDSRHQLNANFVYGIPFGKGRHFTTDSKVLDAIIGGWQLTGLYRQSSGLPTSVGNGRFWPTNWNITGYATTVGPFQDGTNKNAPAPIGGSSGPNVFQNPATALNAFGYTLPGQTGGRNVVRGDGNFNIDLGLGKRFMMPFAESHSLQFRWEVFNVTNSTRFDPQNISADLGNVGSFGKYQGTLTLPRVMQFALRYEF